MANPRNPGRRGKGAGQPSPDELKDVLDRAEEVRVEDHDEELAKPANVTSFERLDPTTAVLAVAESAVRIDRLEERTVVDIGASP